MHLQSRRTFLRNLMIGAAGCALSPALFAQMESKKRPNIVLIIGDDISFDDFGCYGHPHIKTPNIDALATGGLKFNNAYLTTSQCSPTRCSMITGRYPHNTGAPELHMALPEDQVVFPALLQDAGYYTAAAGKWHMGDAPRAAFDRIAPESHPGGEEHWVEVLQERPKDKPFFTWFAAFDAHLPWEVDSSHSPEDAVVPPYLVDTPNTRQELARYYDEIHRLDNYVGKVVDELKAQGEYENTCIIFMADNGRPFPRCKTRLYDSGIKTPFIVHWPNGLERMPAETDSLVSVVDIAPTILAMAGLEAPETVQGVSMLPVLNDTDATIRDYVFAEHNWHVQIAHERMVRHGDFMYIRNAHPQLPQICGIPSQCPQEDLRRLAAEGKLTEAQKDPLLAPRPAEELYNVNWDPHQIHNLAEELDFKPKLDELRAVMDEWQRRTGDTVPPLDKASPDRNNRHTGERIYDHNPTGEVPGEAAGAQKINDPGPIRASTRG